MRKTIGALALLLAASSPLAAQEQKDWPEPREKKPDIDKQLDDALRREYEKDPLVPPVKPRTGEPEKPEKPETPEKPEKPEDEKPPETPREETKTSEEKLKLEWRFKWSHWNLEVTDLHVGASRHGGAGKSTTYGLSDPARSDADGFSVGLDAGEWLTFEATFRYVVARGGELASRDFDLDGHTFLRDQVLDSKFTFLTTDLTAGFKVLHGENGHLDLLGGLRYIGTWMDVSHPGTPDAVGQSVEMLVPELGVGGTVHFATAKKALVFEPYAKALIGGMRFDAGARYRAFSLSVEAGERFLIADVIGVELGYRYELVNLDRGSGGSITRAAHWRAGGMITGIVIQF